MLKTLICFLFIHYVTAQVSNGSIVGTVVENGSNFPLIGVNVFIQSKGTLVATTDENGKYIIKNVPVGTYVLTF